MKRREAISAIMTKDPISVNVTHKVSEVAEIFNQKKIHHIPVVSGEKLIGIISKTDIERISYVSDLQNDKANTAIYDMLKIEQVMTNQVDTVQEDDEIRNAARKFATGEYHALPVLEGDKLSGIVTTTDVIKYLLEQY
ncbi:MAG TPA: CBS domain-containing protein [Saprospiraceae bacterium]|nr:CBS domain-containing protein [Saprospiraceae bacterium]